jgi:hypothetical protein
MEQHVWQLCVEKSSQVSVCHLRSCLRAGRAGHTPIDQPGELCHRVEFRVDASDAGRIPRRIEASTCKS